mgnify:FL=1
MVASDIKIGVKGFKITNNNLFSEAELSSLIKEYENKELTFNELVDGGVNLPAGVDQEFYVVKNDSKKSKKGN